MTGELLGDAEALRERALDMVVAMRPQPGRWRGRALVVLLPILWRARAERWERKRLVRVIRDAYPFEERAAYPYHAWLAARKQVLAAWDLGGELPVSPAVAVRKRLAAGVPELPGQLRMF